MSNSHPLHSARRLSAPFSPQAVGRQTKQHSDTKGDTNKPNAASDARRSAGSHYNKVTRTTSGVKRGEHRPNRKKSGAEAEQQRDGRLQEEKEKMNQYFSREIGGPVRDSGRTRGGTRGGDAESACRHNITSEKQFGASTVRSGGTGAVRRRRAKTTKPLARPVFFAYGNGNTAPSTGGVVYGNYMLSHSIIPQVVEERVLWRCCLVVRFIACARSYPSMVRAEMM